MTEQEYIRRAESLKEQLYRCAAVYLGSPSDAVDAVDEAFYKGFLAYSKLRQPEFFDTWLTRILINVCNSELRRRKRELAVAELPETAQEEFDAARQDASKPKAGSRALIILRYFTGLTLEETARALDIPRGTVSTRQKKALSLLRLELTDE